MARMRTQKELAERDEHMTNAAEYALQLFKDAELRGFTGYDVAISLASTLAARNATLAGKVLVAVGDALRRQPVTKIIPANGTTH